MDQPPIEWLCRRGMKELELPLRRHLTCVYPEASPEERQRFRRLLGEADDDLWNWLYGPPTMPAPDEYQSLVRQLLTPPAPDS